MLCRVIDSCQRCLCSSVPVCVSGTTHVVLRAVWSLLALCLICLTGLVGRVCRFLSVYGEESDSPGGCGGGRSKYVSGQQLAPCYCCRSCCHAVRVFEWHAHTAVSVMIQAILDIVRHFVFQNLCY